MRNVSRSDTPESIVAAQVLTDVPLSPGGHVPFSVTVPGELVPGDNYGLRVHVDVSGSGVLENGDLVSAEAPRTGRIHRGSDRPRHDRLTDGSRRDGGAPGPASRGQLSFAASESALFAADSASSTSLFSSSGSEADGAGAVADGADVPDEPSASSEPPEPPLPPPQPVTSAAQSSAVAATAQGPRFTWPIPCRRRNR
ncbi:hypothetical protein ACFQ10_28005 [Streptomyces indonesiensis]